MFYSGPKVVTTGMAYRTFDWDRATDLVDRCMAGYDVPGGCRDAGWSGEKEGLEVTTLFVVGISDAPVTRRRHAARL